MSELLKPLNIIDDRTIEQIRAEGGERWPNGYPYIKDGVCCVCEAKVSPEDVPMHTCLVHLDIPCACELHLLVQEPQKCTMLAHWASGIERLTAMCDECIVNMLEGLPDNRDWLAPALTDLRARHLKIGARVRIQMGGETGNLGVVYNHVPGRRYSWHVRPDAWPADVPGIDYKADELDVLL